KKERYSAQVWDLATLKRLRFVGRFGEEVNAVAFSPDGSTLAVGSGDRTVRLFDDAGEELSRFDQNGAGTRLAFRPDGAALAVACGKAVFLWDLRTGKATGDLPAHEAAVTGIGYSPDGKYCASVARDGCVMLFAADSHERIAHRTLEIGALGAL